MYLYWAHCVFNELRSKKTLIVPQSQKLPCLIHVMSYTCYVQICKDVYIYTTVYTYKYYVLISGTLCVQSVDIYMFVCVYVNVYVLQLVHFICT